MFDERRIRKEAEAFLSVGLQAKGPEIILTTSVAQRKRLGPRVVGSPEFFPNFCDIRESPFM